MATEKDKRGPAEKPDIPEEFLRPYKPAEHEDTLYAAWEEAGYFNPETCIEKGVTDPDAEPYTIVLPPPNVTGTLHMGHAAMLAVEDILVRYQRMRGRRTLWLPGTDSAAIATQSKVEGIIYKKEKKTRHDLGREEFLKHVQEYALESQGTIINQTKRMGSSLDWSRLAYTLDEKRYNAVMEAFVRMYNDGLIYRGHRIVNWDPSFQTTVSDEEVDHIEQTDPFYYLKYGPFTIGTVRPETKFGDKYVVMHPDDERYKEYEHGQQIEVEWINGPITATIIKDEAADPEVGSGVMTITPAHSAIDFEIAERHELDKEQVIDERGILLPIAGEFEGEHIKEARPKIVEKLKEKGLLEKVDENYTHNIAINSRGGGMIEPQIKKQWFVAVDKEFTISHSEINGIKSGSRTTLKKLMRAAVENGQIDILPKNFEKIYYHWIDNLHDWCISRQIWFGHRIPVWYRGDEVYCGVSSPEGDGPSSASDSADSTSEASTTKGTATSDKEASEGTWEQDPDTLDTWFSSGLWTFSTLGWPEKTEDLKIYHPTTVLETGYDILPFWVSRMILMSAYHLGTIPFETVYFHGLVRDEKGQKMSKSLGNIIDPLDMIEKYGADATRLSLIVGATPGNDVKLSEDKVRGYKHFANKIWNISRFVLTNVADADLQEKPTLSERDTEILASLSERVKDVTDDIESFRLYLAAEKAYHYVWHELADRVIEESKELLNGDGADARAARQYVLYECLKTSLTMLHPFMPFVTESVWQRLPEKDTNMLIATPWPKQ